MTTHGYYWIPMGTQQLEKGVGLRDAWQQSSHVKLQVICEHIHLPVSDGKDRHFLLVGSHVSDRRGSSVVTIVYQIIRPRANNPESHVMAFFSLMQPRRFATIRPLEIRSSELILFSMLYTPEGGYRASRLQSPTLQSCTLHGDALYTESASTSESVGVHGE